MSITIPQLDSIEGLREQLAEHFDFCFSDDLAEATGFRVEGPESFAPIAKEGAGGVFLVGYESGAILYVSSEGQAGIVAKSLTEFLQLLIAHPYWQDLLKFSGGGNVTEMKRAVQPLEQELVDEIPDIEEKRAALYRRLKLQPAKDPISSLHLAVSSMGALVSVLAPDGWESESLFNTFTLRA